MQLVRQSLPVVPNTMAQQIPQQFIQIPQIGQNLSSPLAQHIPQQIPSYVVQNQPVQSPLHQAPQLQQSSQHQSIHNPQQNVQHLQQSLQHLNVQDPQQPIQHTQQIGVDRGPGAIPRPGNPFYVPATNVVNTPHTTFLASTPPAQVQNVHRSPNLSPISVRAPRAPPGFYLHHMSRDRIK